MIAKGISNGDSQIACIRLDHAVVLTKLSLDTLRDREFVGRHRAERVQIAEVTYLRC